MKKFFAFFLFFVMIGLLVLKFRNDIGSRIRPFFNLAVDQIPILNIPCTKPITYSIKTFDPEFNVSREYFLKALSEAEAVWEKPIGKELFTYVPKGGLMEINLMYDYRQQATNKLKSVGISVRNDRESYDKLKTKFDDLNTQFVIKKDEYDKSVVNFNEKQNVYEKKVEYWNALNGAPKEEYDQLQTEKSLLDNEIIRIQNLQSQIKETADEINALVVVLNHIASILNLSVDKFNDINGTLGEVFEEGVYQSDGFSKRIDVYEFSSREKLIRVLAHELGHSLGVRHLEDSDAIMYKLNEGESNLPMDIDVLALKEICGVK